MAITGRIPLPQNGMDAFLEGASKSQAIFDSLVKNRYAAAETQAQLAKNPYIGPQSAADLQKTKLANQYYGKNILSEIGERNAQAGLFGADTNLKRQLLANPGLGGTGVEHEQAVLSLLLQKHPELANQLHQEVTASQSGQSNQGDASQPQLNITPIGTQENQAPGSPLSVATSPVAASQSNAAPQGAPAFNPADALQRQMNAQIGQEEAKAKYYNNGMGGRSSAAIQKQRLLQTNVMRDNPSFNDDQSFEAAGNLLEGKNTLDDGTPINVGGLTQNAMVQAQGSAAPVAVKNQAVQYDILAKDLNAFDIDSIANFTGIGGKARLGIAQAQMLANPDNPNIDPVARRYLSSMKQAILNMDQMRKAYGTSVVPDYVYSTMGRLVNPNDSIWNDKTQVLKTYKDVVKTVEKNRDELMDKVRKGVTSGTSEGSSQGKSRNYNLQTGRFE